MARACATAPTRKLIDFGRSEERPFLELMQELVEFVAEATEHLRHPRSTWTRILHIADDGTSAHRQLEVYEKTQDFKPVVDWLVAGDDEGDLSGPGLT